MNKLLYEKSFVADLMLFVVSKNFLGRLYVSSK